MMKCSAKVSFSTHRHHHCVLGHTHTRGTRAHAFSSSSSLSSSARKGRVPSLNTTTVMSLEGSSQYQSTSSGSKGRHAQNGRLGRRTVVTQLKVLMDSNSGQGQGAVDSSNTLKLNIQGRHLKVTDSLRVYVEDQVTRAVSHFMHHHHDVNNGKNSPISRTDVRLSTRGGPKKNTKGPQLQKSEVTIFTTIGVVRAEVETQDLYNSIDEACKTAERKLRKLKEKAVAKGVWNGHGVRQSKRDTLKSKYDYLEEESEEMSDMSEVAMEYMASEWDMDSFVESVDAQSMSQAEEDMKIYRKKEVDLIPMTVEDALESLQFLGHDFFMFLEKGSNEIKVVYKRDVAGYGVLTPVFPPKQQ